MNILAVEAHFIKNYGNADIQKITGNIHVSYCIPSRLRINHIPQSTIQIRKISAHYIKMLIDKMTI